jgi:hypothetical protein
VLPLGISAAIRLIPAEVRADLRQQAEQKLLARPRSRAGAVMIILVWLLLAFFLIRWFMTR